MYILPHQTGDIFAITVKNSFGDQTYMLGAVAKRRAFDHHRMIAHLLCTEYPRTLLQASINLRREGSWRRFGGLNTCNPDLNGIQPTGLNVETLSVLETVGMIPTQQPRTPVNLARVSLAKVPEDRRQFVMLCTHIRLAFNDVPHIRGVFDDVH